MSKSVQTVKATQVRSAIGCNSRQRSTLRGLGLRRINHTVELKVTPAVLGMIDKVRHLLKLEE